MASEAEARIRRKVEAMMRREWPDARIVHEFELGGVRLDLAAITPDRLILAEVKSENDVLDRLNKQIAYALGIGGPVLVCHAPRWRDHIRDKVTDGHYWRVEWIEEQEDGVSLPAPMRVHERFDRYQNRALMGLLLKPELLALAKPFGGKGRNDVGELQTIAHENLNGREIRRGVLAALRARRFGWTCDAPVKLPEAAPNLTAQGGAQP